VNEFERPVSGLLLPRARGVVKPVQIGRQALRLPDAVEAGVAVGQIRA